MTSSRWNIKTRAPLNARFVIAGDGVVVPDLSTTRSDRLSRFALDDGEQRWQVPLEDFVLTSALGGVSMAADPDGATVYVAQGTMVAAFAATDGAKRWAAQVPPAEPFESFTIVHTPRVEGDRVYLLSRHSRVVAIARDGGALVWRTDDLESAADLVIRRGVVITRSLEAHDVRAFDGATGAPLWQRAVTGFARSERLATSLRLAPDDGAYLVADGERALLALDAATGAVRWEEPVVGLASYAFAGAVVVVADGASVRGLDAATGAAHWRHPTGGTSLVAPLDEASVVLALPTAICTVDAGSGTIAEQHRHRLHEQDRVLDARDGAVVMTTDTGIARAYRRDGDKLAERTIGEVAARPDEPAAHGIQQAMIATGGVVTFNTAHELALFAR